MGGDFDANRCFEGHRATRRSWLAHKHLFFAPSRGRHVAYAAVIEKGKNGDKTHQTASGYYFTTQNKWPNLLHLYS